MSYRFCRLTLVTVLAFFCGSQSLDAVTPLAIDLPKVILDQVDRIANGYDGGNALLVVESGGKLIQKIDEQRLEEVNTYLVQKKFPPLEEMLISARISLDRPNVNVKIPAPGSKEVIFLAEQAKKILDEMEKQVHSNDLLRGEVITPDKYAEYEKQFWNLHVVRNQLSNALHMARSIHTIIEQRKSRLLKVAVSDARKKILEHDFGTRAISSEEMLMDLEEREALLRIYRLNDTISRDLPGLGEKEKFQFAYNINADVNYLENFFKEFNGKPFVREDLNDKSILALISGDALKIREKYADKIAKGELLFLGLHWWFRGRYGSGPLAQGMLKAPGAHLNEKTLFPLAMPQARPEPDDPYQDNYQIPHYERRHHYVWQIQQESIHRYQKRPMRKTVSSTDSKVPEGAKTITSFY